MRIAFKEWVVLTDALARGEQIFILRKGGIHEGRGGFQMEHPEFLLFPTLFHQQRESVVPSAQERFDAITSAGVNRDQVRIEYFARVTEWHHLPEFSDVAELSGQHIWRDEVIAERFEWGRTKGIYAIAVRVYQLQTPANLPLLPSYGGCKSWIELEQDLSIENARPVLSDEEFSRKLAHFKSALPAPLPR